MRLIKEKLYEEFSEKSDPIEDIGIGYNWIIIEKGIQMPDDFVDEHIINREKYIIERGFINDPEWYDEYKSSSITLEMIGAIILGSNAYAPMRYRRRKTTDKPWNVEETYEYQTLKPVHKLS